MAVTSKRERALQIVLVVVGLLIGVANIYPLVTYFLAGPSPTGGTLFVFARFAARSEGAVAAQGG